MEFTLLSPKIRKKDIAEFFQKMSMLISSGYDSCSAAQMLAAKSDRKRHRDRAAEGIRRTAALVLPALTEGYALYEALGTYPKYFGLYVKQIQVGEASGKTGEVLLRISEQIKNANKTMRKLRSAMTYPVAVLLFTFGAAYYLFSSVLPDMLAMLRDVGVTELPTTTQIVLTAGEWAKAHGLFLILLFLFGAGILTLYAKTIGRMSMSRLATRIPLIGGIIRNNSMAMFFSNWQLMLLAGAEMSAAMKSAAEAVPNGYMRRLLMSAYYEYSENGVPVYETLVPLEIVRELEVQTIHVAIEGNRITDMLYVLAEDRNYEAERAIKAFTTAINPILIGIVGVIVGIIVMSVYQPIINVSNSLAA